MRMTGMAYARLSSATALLAERRPATGFSQEWDFPMASVTNDGNVYFAGGSMITCRIS